VEALGRQVKVFPGLARNLKVTTTADLALAQALVAQGGEG
jgi:2-C-methyl-D-erythritol 4-phosphate cytidylyltransferase